jgi:hypothetical protein
MNTSWKNYGDYSEPTKILSISHVLKDGIIELREVGAFEKCPYKLRRIEFYNEKKQEIPAFLPIT